VYVFSEHFYKGEAGQSQLEILVTKYLQDKEITPEELIPVYDNSKFWSDNDRKYYMPVLTVLSLYANDNMQSTWLKKDM
jgi:hypothetical protein